MTDTALTAVLNHTTAYTVPGGKRFVGQIARAGSNAAMPVIVNGVTLAQLNITTTNGNSPSTIKPFSLNAGDVVSTTNAGFPTERVCLLGDLFDALSSTAVNTIVKSGTSYTVPALKRFEGQIINNDSAANTVNVNGVQMSYLVPVGGADTQPVQIKPFTLNAGDVVSCASAIGVALIGQLVPA